MNHVGRALVYQDDEIMELAKDEWPFPTEATFVCENGHIGSSIALCPTCGSNLWFFDKAGSNWIGAK